MKLVANLPYCVATPVISNLIATDLPWTKMVVTVQYEMAERMAAAPGGDQYSGLADWLQATQPLGETRITAFFKAFAPALDALHAAGLLQLRMAGTQRFYRLNPDRLARYRAYVADLDKPREEPADVINDTTWIDPLPLSPEDKKIVAEYTVSGRLTRFPSKEKRWLAILRWLATRFEPGRRYSEREVNVVLTDVHPDYASLRRDLVEFGFMRRERGGGDYWLTPENEAPAH